MRTYGKAVALCVLFMVFASPLRAAEAVHNVALSIFEAPSDHITLWVKSLKQHPAVTSGMVKITVFQGNGDYVAQDAVTDVIASRKTDAAIIIANDVDMGARFVTKLNDAGIPVMAAGVHVGAGDVLGYIGPDDVAAGYLTAKAVFDAMGGAGGVVVLRGPDMSPVTAARNQGIEEALREYPGIHVVDSGSANWWQMDAYNQMQIWLSRYPDRIEGVVAQNDDMALGALRALQTERALPIPVAGIDGIPEAVEAVEKGEMLQTLFQDPVLEAQGTLDMILAHLRGDGYTYMSESWKKYPEVRARSRDGFSLLVPWKEISAAETASADTVALW